MSDLENAAAAGVKAELAAFGEDVQFDELGDGLPVTLRVIVDRRPVEVVEIGGIGSETSVHMKRTVFALNIPTDAVLALASITITKNADTVELKKDLGDAEDTTFKVITDPKVSGGFRRVLITA